MEPLLLHLLYIKEKEKELWNILMYLYMIQRYHLWALLQLLLLWAKMKFLKGLCQISPTVFQVKIICLQTDIIYTLSVTINNGWSFVMNWNFKKNIEINLIIR